MLLATTSALVVRLCCDVLHNQVPAVAEPVTLVLHFTGSQNLLSFRWQRVQLLNTCILVFIISLILLRKLNELLIDAQLFVRCVRPSLIAC